MPQDTILLPGSAKDFVFLARTQKGRLYRKEILHMGKEFVHPADPTRKIKVTPELVASLEKNFNDGIGDIVQVPIVNENNAHTEDPTRNIGEVVGVEHDDKGVYVIIDDRRTDAQISEQGELGKTLIGASALIHLNYPDTETGALRGPTLLHTAITNRPYITKLDDFEEIIAASADTLGVDQLVIMRSVDNLSNEEQENGMTREELLAELKNKFGIDVAALSAAAAAGGDGSGESSEEPTLDELLATLKDKFGIDVKALQEAAKETKPDTKKLVAAMSAVLTAAGTEPVPSPEEGLTVQSVADALIELAGEKVELSNQVAELVADRDASRLKAAEQEIDGYVTEGRILPKQRAKMLKLSMEDRETFDELLPATPIVALSSVGSTTHETPNSEEFDKEAERLVAMAKGL